MAANSMPGSTKPVSDSSPDELIVDSGAASMRVSKGRPVGAPKGERLPLQRGVGHHEADRVGRRLRILCERTRMKKMTTREVIDRYFELMGRGEDFAVYYADDVQWTTLDGGTVASGPSKVRNYLAGLHRNMPDIQTRPRAYADETAYVEGDCADPRSTGDDRIAFCVAYDVANGVITAARCYGAVGFLGPVDGVDSGP